MNPGDLVQATWSDGLVCTGRYLKTARGYVILVDGDTDIVCNKYHVAFEVIDGNENGDRIERLGDVQRWSASP